MALTLILCLLLIAICGLHSYSWCGELGVTEGYIFHPLPQLDPSLTDMGVYGHGDVQSDNAGFQILDWMHSVPPH